MAKQITIVFRLLMSFIVTHCAVPVVVQAPKAVPALEKAAAAKSIDKNIALMADEINIDITVENCAAVISLLNSLLADEYVLYVKTQNFHWNIRNSMNFNDLHLFFWQNV